jgi:uncharacterized repeat protein (TIGR02543 family)
MRDRRFLLVVFVSLISFFCVNPSVNADPYETPTVSGPGYNVPSDLAENGELVFAAMSQGRTAIDLSKVYSNGEVSLIRSFSGPTTINRLDALDVAPDQSIYLIGYLNEGCLEMICLPSGGSFLLKLDQNGDTEWGVPLGGSANLTVTDSSRPVVSYGTTDGIRVQTYSTSGQVLNEFSVLSNSAYYGTVKGIDLDIDENIFLATYTSSKLRVTKFSPTGVPYWGKSNDKSSLGDTEGGVEFNKTHGKLLIVGHESSINAYIWEISSDGSTSQRTTFSKSVSTSYSRIALTPGGDYYVAVTDSYNISLRLFNGLSHVSSITGVTYQKSGRDSGLSNLKVDSTGEISFDIYNFDNGYRRVNLPSPYAPLVSDLTLESQSRGSVSIQGSVSGGMYGCYESCGDARIELNYSLNADMSNATKILLRSSSSSSPESFSYVLENLSLSTTYYFQVVADRFGARGVSAISPFQVLPDLSSTPLNLSAVASVDRIELSWDTPVDDGGSAIIDYVIKISTDNANWSLVSDGESVAEGATVGSLNPNSSYYFRVAAVTSAGIGQFASGSVIQTALPDVPGAPSLLCSITGLQASLSWTPSQAGGRFETGFLIQKKLGSGTWSDLTSKTSDVFSYSETTNASQSGNISYRVRSVNDGGNSDWSSACTILAPSIPSAPNSVTGPSLSALNMTMSWSAPSNGGMQIDSYEIEKRIGILGSWYQVYNAEPILGTTQIFSETQSTSSSGEIHYYRLRAVNAVGNSPWSNIVSVQIPSVPSSPMSIVASGGSNDITISWNEPQNISSAGPLTYLFQVTNNGLTWVDFEPSSFPTSRSAKFDSAIGGVSYRFRVKAVNAFGESSWSTSSNLSQLAASYTLTYIYDDATSGNTISSATYTEGESGVLLPTPTRKGYTFVGWFSSPTFTGRALVSPYAPTDSHSMYAKWSRNAVKAIASTKPTISGTAKVSKTLTAKKGTWTGYPTLKIAYQWYSCSNKVSSPKSSVPKACKKITGATKSTINLKKAQKGKYLALLVTGKSNGTSSTSWLTKSTKKVK